MKSVIPSTLVFSTDTFPSSGLLRYSDSMGLNVLLPAIMPNSNFTGPSCDGILSSPVPSCTPGRTVNGVESREKAQLIHNLATLIGGREHHDAAKIKNTVLFQVIPE